MGLRGLFRTLLIGAGAGAAVVYLNDPEKGQQRRDQLMRRAQSTAEDLRDTFEDTKQEVMGAVDTAREEAEQKIEQARDGDDGGEGADMGATTGPSGTVDVTDQPAGMPTGGGDTPFGGPTERPPI